MNILFIGPYKQLDGWGYASRGYINALSLTKNNLHIRPIYFNKSARYSGQEFERFEVNQLDSYDVIIQHSLPHTWKYYGGHRNIGLSFYESTIDGTPWNAYCNLMDELWVCSSWEKNILITDTKVNVIPIPIDITKYNKPHTYKELDPYKHEFKFYFIGEYITRKNIDAIIKAFNYEFKTYEQARLVLKLNKHGKDGHDLLNIVQNEVSNLKSHMGLFLKPELYKPELVITKRLTDDEINGLHYDCDCFVAPSKGEAFCIPAFDALMFGNQPIVNKNSSMGEYITPEIGHLVNSELVSCYSTDKPIPFLYTGKDYWYDVSIEDLRSKMRTAFNNRDKQGIKNRSKKLMAEKFDVNNIAEKLDRTLRYGQ